MRKVTVSCWKMLWITCMTRQLSLPVRLKSSERTDRMSASPRGRFRGAGHRTQRRACASAKLLFPFVNITTRLSQLEHLDGAVVEQDSGGADDIFVNSARRRRGSRGTRNCARFRRCAGLLPFACNSGPGTQGVGGSGQGSGLVAHTSTFHVKTKRVSLPLRNKAAFREQARIWGGFRHG